MLPVCSLLLFLQTEPGRVRARGIAVAQIESLLAEDATVSLEHLSGTFLTDLTIEGLSIRKSGQPVIEVETASVSYNLLTLLRRTFSASRLTARGVRVTARQDSTGTFDAADLLAPTDTPADTTGGFTVNIERVAVTDGTAAVHFHAPSTDSTLHVDDLRLVLQDLATGPDGLSGDVKLLRLNAIAPKNASTVQLATTGAISKDGIALRRLRMTSSTGTKLEGEAQMAFVSGRVLPVIEAELRAAPLNLNDVSAFTGAPVQGQPRLTFTADTHADTLRWAFNADLGEASAVMQGGIRMTSSNGLTSARAGGALRNLRPADFLTPEAAASLPETVFTGSLNADLTGSSLSTLTGPYRLDLTESRVDERTIERLRLNGEFANGRTTFDFGIAMPGVRLTAQGAARPFAETPSFRVQGRTDEIDLARFIGDPAQTAQFRGRFDVEGRGSSLKTLDATGSATLTDAHFQQAHIDRLATTFRIRNRTLTFDAAGRVAGENGRLAVQGNANLGAQPLSYRITEGRLDRVNLAALTGNAAQASDLTGTFQLDGRGTDPERLILSLTAALHDSRYSTFDILSASTEARVEKGRATFDVTGDLGRAGAFQAIGGARLFPSPLVLHAEGQAQNLNLGALTGNPRQRSALTGAFTVSATGPPGPDLALDATLNLEDSQYADTRIESGRLDVTLRSGDLRATGRARTPSGNLDFSLVGRPLDETATFVLSDDSCFSNLDLGTLLDLPTAMRLNGCFSGSLSGSLSGSDPATAQGRGTLTLRGSQIGDAQVERGDVTFSLDRGIVNADMDLGLIPENDQAARASLTLTGKPFDEIPRITLSGQVRNLNPDALFGQRNADFASALTADVALEATGYDSLATAQVRGSVTAGTSTLRGVRIDTLHTQFAFAHEVLQLDTLALESEVASAAAGGTLNLGDRGAPTNLQLMASVRTLEPVARLVEQPLSLRNANLSLSVTENAERDLAVTGSLDAEEVIFGPYAVISAFADVDATLPPTLFSPKPEGPTLRTPGAVRATLATTFRTITTPALIVERGDASLTYADSTLSLSTEVNLDGNRALSLDSRIQLDPTVSRATLSETRLRLSDHTWHLAQPTTLSLENALQVRGLLLVSDDGTQQIAADGLIDPNGNQNAVVTAENVDIGPFTSLLDRFDDLGGHLTTALIVSGPATSPVLRGSVTLENLTSQGEAFGSFQASLDYADGLLNLDGELAHASGKRLTLTGSIPRRFSFSDGTPQVTDAEDTDRVRLSIQSEAFPIAWAQPFVDPYTYNELGGFLTADIEMTGTQAGPQLTGSASLIDGTLGLVATGRTYSPLTARLDFRDNRIVIEEAVIRNEAGGPVTFSAGGTVTLRELSVGELDLTLRPQGLVAMDTRTYRKLTLSRGSEPLRLTGTLDAPRLRGAVVLQSGEIYLTDELAAPDVDPVVLSPSQVRHVEARFGRRIAARDTSENRFIDALDYDLTVEIRRNVWLRSSEGFLPFDIEFAGDVQAGKESLAESQNLFGTIDLVSGSVQFLQRRFQIVDGTLTFNGPPLEAYVDLAATLDARPQGSSTPIAVTLGVTGRFDQNPEVRLTSTPALDPADIVSVVTTGRVGGSDALRNAFEAGVTGLAVGTFLSGFEDVLSGSVGLDVLQIDTDEGHIVLRLGEYLGTRTFVSAAFPVDPNRRDDVNRERRQLSTAALEYQIWRWLALEGSWTRFSGYPGDVGGGANIEFTY